MASHPSPGDLPERERAVRKNSGTKQKWQRETQSSTIKYAPEFSTPSYFSLHRYPSAAHGQLQTVVKLLIIQKI